MTNLEKYLRAKEKFEKVLNAMSDRDRKIVNILAKAIYFADNSDYLSAMFEALNKLVLDLDAPDFKLDYDHIDIIVDYLNPDFKDIDK